MKKNNIRIIAAAAGILLLAGCSNDGGMGADADAGSITIDASIGRMTKVSADGTNFTAGDAIALYAWTGDAASVPGTRVVDGVVNTFDGNRWNPASLMRWGNNGVEHYFLGIFPAPANVSNFTEAGYRLDPADYTASDLLVATNLNGVTPSNGTVSLTFEHVMAKLGVNIKFNDEYASNTQVTSVSVSARRNATVNYLTGSVTATGDESYVLLSAKDEPATGYNKSYSGIQVPQTISHITVIAAGKTYIYDSPTGITLTSGKFTNVGLTIGREEMELATMSVTDWTAGESRSDANAELANYHNGYEFVDMGLSVKWATCNVGANKPDECGAFFAWGETEPKNYFVLSNYKYFDGPDDFITKYNDDRWYGIVDNIYKLDAEDDAAHVQWGGNWRMPTLAEWNELMNNSKIARRTTSSGYSCNGCLITSKINGNSIFLPAAGYIAGSAHYNFGTGCEYWLSSLRTSYWAYQMHIYYDSYKADSFSRNVGMSIRPVCP